MQSNRAAILAPLLLGCAIYILFGFIGASGTVQATHFRGGTISWKPSDKFSLTYREIMFTFKLGWRLSRIGCNDKTISSGTLVGEDARWFCMFGCEGVIATTREKCTEYNTGEDWLTGSNTFTHVFDTDGPIEISYMDCCWLTDLVVGAGGEWSLTTTLNLGLRSDTGRPNTSPVVAMAPMITLRAGVPDVINLAVRDVDGDKITCRLGTYNAECGSICKLFPEFTLDKEKCIIHYNPISNTTGKVPIAVMVEDHPTSSNGITMGQRHFGPEDSLSSVPMQFLIVLRVPPADCSDKPTIETSVASSEPVTIRPGKEFEFRVVSAPCDIHSSIEEYTLIAPAGVRKSPIVAVEGRYYTNITWTPQTDQDGSNPICITARSSTGVLSDEVCITANVPKAMEFCTVVGGPHFITFDKARYDFYGMCQYELVRTKRSEKSLTPMAISLSNAITKGDGIVRLATLYVEIGENRIKVNKLGSVYLNDVAVNLPVRLKSGLRIEKNAKGISITLTYALHVYLDDDSLSIQLPRSYMSNVEGLCGNFNGNSSDDMTMNNDNSLASGANEFASSFRIENDIPCNTGHVKPLNDSCMNNEKGETAEKCNIIKKENGCFTNCHDVIDPKPFYKNCISALCSDDVSTLGVQIRAYADECQREKVEKFCDWRSELQISMECPPYSHYENCARAVPVTCADSDFTVKYDPTQSCIEGCVCNSGFILSGNNCVPQSECGCIINDNYYPKGFTYRLENCQEECICGKDCVAVDSCSKGSTCTKGADGFYRCVERLRSRATCKAVADPHYRTFDGMEFDSMGNCAYVMVRSKRNSNATYFQVVAVNAHPNYTNNGTHVKEVHVVFGGGHTLSFYKGPKMMLDDKLVNSGSNLYGVAIRKVGQFVVADFNFGLVIRWDGVDRLRITAWSPLRNMVEGMCGDFDGDPKNDFATRLTDENLPDPGSFAEIWRIKGYGTEGCSDHPGVKTPQPPCPDEKTRKKYEEDCRIVTDPNGPFASCHDSIAPEKVFSNCIYDLCATDGDSSIKERNFASYTDDCLEEQGILKSWRAEGNFTISCPPGSFYSSCMEQCQPSCGDLDASICLAKTPQQLGPNCVEGCACNDGYVLSGDECVPQKECGCLVNGRYEKKGFTFSLANCTETCECMGPDQLVCGETPFGCQKNRDSCVTRDDGYFECAQRLRKRATCKAVTDPHYRTFDKKNYDSMGTCAYIMVRSKASSSLPAFRVVAVNEQSAPNQNVSHVKEVWAHVGDLTLSFTQGGIVRINGKVVNPGTAMNGVEIRSVGRFTVADFDFGLVIRWDGKDRLRVSAWGKLRGQLEGLCGDFDELSSNDFMTPTGEIVENITNFVNSWVIGGYDSEGCRDPVSDPPLHACSSDAEHDQYSTECALLLNETGPFGLCHLFVDPVPTYDDCVFDLCIFNGNETYKNRLFTDYKNDCEEANVTNIEWSDPLTSCPENSRFENCAPQCQSTCTDPDGSKCSSAGNLGETCTEACVCENGYLRSGNECVPEQDCGCVADDGKYFKPGFTYRKNNCKTECRCMIGGKIDCYETSQCSKGYRCRIDMDGYRRCIKHIRRRATCKAVTDPHYSTFDGVNYDSMGTCAYIMIRSKANSDLPSFRVVAVNEQPDAKKNVSHVKEVHVEIAEDLTVSFRAGPVVLINDEVVNPGTTMFGVQIRKVGRYTVAEFPFGLVVRWDGIDRLRMSAWGQLKGKMEGLCGDFNDDPSNDYMTPEGNIENATTTFVNSWKVDGYNTEGCIDPDKDDPAPLCDDPATLEEFKQSCSLLTNPNGAFASCQQIRDPNSAFNDCVFDLCAYDGDEALKERVISSFAEDCKEDEADPLTWRLAENLVVPCENKSHFIDCMSQCQPTCGDPDSAICKATSSQLGTHCVEGCQCDDGFILSGDKCVPVEECGCEIKGRYFEKGHTYFNDNCTLRCVCEGNGKTSCLTTGGCDKEFRCRKNDKGQKQCLKHIRRRATCKAVTDPHYMTFDGKRFDSMGTCAYIMVRSKENSNISAFRVIAINEQPEPDKIVSHVKEVYVEVGKDLTLSFSEGPVVKINGEVVLPGSTVNDVEVRKVGRFTVAEFKFGLVVKWDGIDRVRIIAWGQLRGQIEGICGDFDDNPNNDFTTPGGVIEPDKDRFVTSWIANGYSEKNCRKSPQLQDSNCTSNVEFEEQMRNDCSVLIDPNGSFAPCHNVVDPFPAFEDCLFDLCVYGGNETLRDRHIHEYTESCLEERGRPRTSENITSDTCKENSRPDIMSQCQPTCDDLDASKCLSDSLLDDTSVEGCRCIEGTVLSGERCVTVEECGCLIDGRYRQKGYRYLNEDCDLLCECVGEGKLKCLPTDGCKRNEICAKNDQGQYQCQLRQKNFATCSSLTDPHYTTFDGKTFDSMGTCAYVMVRSRNDTDLPKFSVVAVNEQTDSDKPSATIKEAHIQVGDDFKIALVRKQGVRVNGVMTNPGSTVKGASIRAIGRYIVIDYPFGMVIRWDGADSLRITVHDQMRGKVEGLCGDYDSNTENDFVTPDGNTVENAMEFVKSWKVLGYHAKKCTHQYTVANPCSNSPVDLAMYRSQCSLITNPEGQFAQCHKVLDPTDAFEDCMYDMCILGGSRSKREAIFASYLHDCHELGAQPEPWRFTEGMPLECPANSKYTRCMRQCQPTCSDSDATICRKMSPYLGSYCVEGCKCLPGFYWSNKKCVRDSKCGCLVNGIYYTKGFKFRTDSCKRACQCRGENTLFCEDSPGCLDNERCNIGSNGFQRCMPLKRRRATCLAITDPHYTTFDGTTYDSQGVCAYTMVRTKSLSSIEPFTVVTVNEQPLPKTKVSHVKEIHVEYKGDQKLSFYKGPELKLNGEVVIPGLRASGIEIIKVGRFTTAVFDFGLTVRWDGSDRLRVIAREALRGEIEGMCGDFDDDRSNDLIHGVTGEVVTDIDEFVHSWRASGYGVQCPEVELLSDAPDAFSCSEPEVRKIYEAKCSFLTNPEGPLKNCKKLGDMKSIFNNCVLDMCAYSGDEFIKERLVSNFAEICREEGGKLQKEWREEANLTQVSCPPNSHFSTCMTPCQGSCGDIEATQCKTDLAEILTTCVEGCQANTGYIQSGDTYVLPTECGCVKDGRYYMHGQKFYTPHCATHCECKAGFVKCRKTECARDEQCIINSAGKLDCVKIEMSTCQAWGSTFYKTFDGRNFQSSSKCYYVLSKYQFDRNDALSRTHGFWVTISTLPSETNPHLFTIKNVRVRILDLGVSALLRPGAESRVFQFSDVIPKENTVTTEVDLEEYLVNATNVFNWNNGKPRKLLTINRRGTFTVLKTYFGLEVAYDGNNIRITIPKVFAGKTSGICGNYNGDPSDDLKLKDGTIGNDVKPFIHEQRFTSCKTKDLPPYECSEEDKKKWSSLDKCGAITDPSSEFSHCATKLNSAMYFEQCVNDVCLSNGSSAVLKKALKVFAHSCMAVNAPVCSWRRTYMLQVACPVNSHYVGCAKACEDTCGLKYQTSCQYQEVEDCVCDVGYVRHDGACIPEANCGGCMINRQLVSKGFTYRKDKCSEECECLGNDKVVCYKAKPCIKRARCGKDNDGFQKCLIKKREKARCQVYGNTHFLTFDGQKFSSTATCGFIMVRSRADAKSANFSVVVKQEASRNANYSRVTEVHVSVGDMNMIMTHNSAIWVNGGRVQLGSELAGVSVRKVGVEVVAFFDFGLVLRWNGKERLRVDVWRVLKGQIEGLCGDFDDDDENDFRTPEGIIETDLSVFVNSWRNEKWENSCRLRKPTKVMCESTDNVCDDLINKTSSPEEYAYCLYERCANNDDPTATELSLQSLRETDIAANLLSLPKLIAEMSCPNNSHFNSCMDECQPTCSDPDTYHCKSTQYINEECVYGCQCNDGYILDGAKCSKQSECGCVGNDGSYFPNHFDSYLENCNGKCQCQNGSLTCQEVICDKDQQFCGYRGSEFGCHWKDECKYDNGGCSHICLWMNKVSCSCPPGYMLNADKVSCNQTDDWVPPVMPDTGKPCDKSTVVEDSKWKQDTMQVWIKKLDTYMSAMRQGLQTGSPTYACSPMWTGWFDRDDPDNDGDDESFRLLKEANSSMLCDHPVAIEARLKDGRNAAASGNVIRILDPKKGLLCMNSDQREGERCGDFQIRFLCLEELI